MLVRIVALILFTISYLGDTFGQDRPLEKQVYELRTISFANADAALAFDRMAESALIPALNRLGIRPVGAFAMAATQPPQGSSSAPLPPNDITKESPKTMLLLPADRVELLLQANELIEKDAEFQKAAAEYLDAAPDKPLIQRISSELLVAFDAWPKVNIQKPISNPQKRLFELRTYESPSEHHGHLKVEMFNSGEVPIFLECGIQPVFMGQAVFGNKMPNLTYMTVYDSPEARNAAWKRFAESEKWKVLREVAKYQGTVSKIHKTDWHSKPYSQL